MCRGPFGYHSGALKHQKLDVNAQDNNGTTALMVASEKDHVKVRIGELLKHDKMDANARNEDRATALLVATEMGHVEAVCMLLNCNCAFLNHASGNKSDVFDDDGCDDVSVRSWNGYSKVGLSLLASDQVKVANTMDEDSSPDYRLARGLCTCRGSDSPGYARDGRRECKERRWRDSAYLGLLRGTSLSFHVLLSGYG